MPLKKRCMTRGPPGGERSNSSTRNASRAAQGTKPRKPTEREKRPEKKSEQYAK